MKRRKRYRVGKRARNEHCPGHVKDPGNISKGGLYQLNRQMCTKGQWGGKQRRHPRRAQGPEGRGNLRHVSKDESQEKMGNYVQRNSEKKCKGSAKAHGKKTEGCWSKRFQGTGIKLRETPEIKEMLKWRRK